MPVPCGGKRATGAIATTKVIVALTAHEDSPPPKFGDGATSR
ncbi:hypothetical protein [Laceyella putida]|uniref:Uncharacterized protein n=1 Tax=Laceyella putida TaxID=110101 RepID=A0ABW2RJJ4_9BACL